MKIEVEVGRILRKKKLTLAVAESCTGGLISDRITDVSGSSEYFTLGVVAYSDKDKENILGVSGKLIKRYGAVSEQVCLEMAKGVRLLANVDIGIGVTGIAGPTGGTRSKPVGLVYVALVTNKRRIVRKFHFKGLRRDIKLQTSQAALELLGIYSSRRLNVGYSVDNLCAHL